MGYKAPTPVQRKALPVAIAGMDLADRLFEMGFAEQLNEIVRECPKERQTLLFSATMPQQLIQFSRAGLRDPQLIRLDTDSKMSEELRMAFFSVRSNEKLAALLYLVRQVIPPNQLTIIFTATRHHSEMIHAFMQRIGVSSTLVYGTMDQDVRSMNLKSFRDGEVSYMIVTDLAARGIDVPLLNNVINYHFPPTPKLFVHRCGRAARQGRIGFAISLVEPEELAFMMDVHTFLGMEGIATNNNTGKVFDAKEEKKEDGTTGIYSNNNNDANNAALISYNLETMTPAMVHTGLFPQDVIDEDNDFIKRALAEDDHLAMMWRISENGMMQYRRTRTEASREGVKAAKAVTKANAIRTIHPLIVGCDPKHCNQDVIEKANFVRMLQTFRPAQTVFETGIGTGTSNNLMSKAHGGHLQTSKTKLTKGIEMMKAFRQTTVNALERNRVSARREPGSDDEKEEDDDAHSDASDNSDADSHDDDEDEGGEGEGNDEFFDADSVGEAERVKAGNMHTNSKDDKTRLSIGEKRKMKRKGMTNADIAEMIARRALSEKLSGDSMLIVQSGQGREKNNLVSRDMSGEAQSSTSGGWKDKHYMAYGNEDIKANFTEDSMQPNSGLRSSEQQGARMIEEALMDVAPDEAYEMNKKKRVMRWDAKKRKFVKQSLEEMASNQQKGAKRMRTESGVIVKGSSKPQGELYEKWKKKSHREIGGFSTGENGDDDDRPRPNVKVNRHVKDELRGGDDIRKSKKTSADNKVKNMKKDKRSKFEASAKKKKSEAAKGAQGRGTKAGSRKTKAIVRY
eukprot:gene22841-29015_t